MKHHTPETEAIMAGIFNVDDMSDLKLFMKLKAANHLVNQLIAARPTVEAMSHSRMRLLVRLTANERQGKTEGLSPSDLSRYSGVSRNTISALLNGLEERNLIERHVNPEDRRQFKIRITPGGQELVQHDSPVFAQFISDLFDPLSPEERVTLQTLLDKLFHGLIQKADSMGLHTPTGDTGTSSDSKQT